MRDNAQRDRFKGAPWFPQQEEIVVVGGAGGIGSWLTFFLTRAGFRPLLYDFDSVETHNLSGQLFRQEDIGKYKVDAVASIINTFDGGQVDIMNSAFTKDSPSHHFMFSAFDNMAARRVMFEKWKESIPNHTVAPIFIDGRLELEQMQIFCVTADKLEEYEKHLFDDSLVEDAACTARQVSHTAAGIAFHMVNLFTNHITNIYKRKKLASVPFYYEYFGPAALTVTRDE